MTGRFVFFLLLEWYIFNICSAFGTGAKFKLRHVLQILNSIDIVDASKVQDYYKWLFWIGIYFEFT